MIRTTVKLTSVVALAALIATSTSAEAGKPGRHSGSRSGGNSSGSNSGGSLKMSRSSGLKMSQGQQGGISSFKHKGLGNGIGSSTGNSQKHGNLQGLNGITGIKKSDLGIGGLTSKHKIDPKFGIGNGKHGSIFGQGNGLKHKLGNGLQHHLGNGLQHKLGNGIAAHKFGGALHCGKFQSKSAWCFHQPKFCWWWYDYCPNYCLHLPTFHSCNYYYVPCPVVVGGPVVTWQWYLGVQGVVLPGKGLAINTVDAGSPAALAGLQPGMVITQCNGILLTDEAAVQQSLQTPNGLLEMFVLTDGAQAPLPVTIQMLQVSNVTY
jgi:hypothetical protein